MTRQQRTLLQLVVADIDTDIDPIGIDRKLMEADACIVEALDAAARGDTTGATRWAHKAQRHLQQARQRAVFLQGQDSDNQVVVWVLVLVVAVVIGLVLWVLTP